MWVKLFNPKGQFIAEVMPEGDGFQKPDIKVIFTNVLLMGMLLWKQNQYLMKITG